MPPEQLQPSDENFPDGFPEPATRSRPRLPVASLLLGAGLIILIVMLVLAW